MLGYNGRGAVSIVVRGGTTVWTLGAQDAAGRTRMATLGSGLVTVTGYNPFTALLETIQTGPGNGAGGVTASLQSDSYGYDAVGNLLTRSWLPASGAAAMSETFTYDALDRLKSSQVGGLDIKNFTFDALGNVVFKTNVGSYTYVGHPHLVSGIAGTVAGLTNPGFTYDANGNTQSGLNRWYTWSAANLPLSVDQLSNGTQASATLRHEFLYGPDRERTREIVRAMSGTTIGAVQRTIYSADSIEKEIDAVAGTTKIRTYLPLGLGFTEEDFAGTAIAPTAIGTPAERYYHKDNLGSPVVVTDASQAVLERMAYDAWGRRRQSNGLEVDWQSLSAQSASNTLDHKGYTDQEQLDDLSLVHLNGRVYDPMTARFTSPDPTIPDPYDLQSLNRASYVRNSPMDKVDPTGFTDAPQPTQPPQPTYKNDGGILSVDAKTVGPVNLGGGTTVSTTTGKPVAAQADTNRAISTQTGSKSPDAKDAGGGCGGHCAVTGAEDGMHGLPSGVPLAQQQEVDRIANGVALRAAPVAVATALAPEVVASLASNPLGRLFLLTMGINAEATSDLPVPLPVGGSFVPKQMITTGTLVERTFATSIGPVDFMAEAVVSGKQLTLKDAVLYGRGETPLTGMTKDIYRGFETMKSWARDHGFESLEISGTRAANSSSATPGSAWSKSWDLTK